jgi:D-alanyl-D-alanine carboxypeptidase
MQNKFLLMLACMTILLFSCRKPLVGVTSACNPDYPDSSSLHPKKVIFQAILDKYRKKGLPGIAVLLQDEDGVWTGSAGKSDIGEGIDFKTCTVSKAASITKMILAAAVMQLREQGIVNLDDKASRWLDKEIVANISNADKVTLGDLMYHRTGIYDIIADSDFYLAVLNNPNRKWSGRDLAKFAYGKPMVFEYTDKAAKGGYSNTNTLLLSMCIESITGKPHGELMHSLVIDRLGMRNTYYSHHDELPAFTAQGYYDLYNNGTIVNVSNLVTGSGNGYGGIYTNVTDLHKFMKALFIDKILVNQASLDMMQAFIDEDEGGNLGMGLLQEYKKLGLHLGTGHSGRDLGYSGDAHYFPTRNNRMFINLVNYGTNGSTPLGRAFYEMRDEFVTELLK